MFVCACAMHDQLRVCSCCSTGSVTGTSGLVLVRCVFCLECVTAPALVYTCTVGAACGETDGTPCFPGVLDSRSGFSCSSSASSGVGCSPGPLSRRTRSSLMYGTAVMFDKDAGTLARYGCVAEMTRMDNLPDGRMMTLSDGVQRFRILKLVKSDRDEPGAAATPYLVGLVRLISDETATAAPTTPTDKAPPPAAAPEARAAETPDDLVKAAAAADAGDATPADAPPASGPPLTRLGMWQLERNVWVALQDVLRLSNKLYDRTLELNAGLLNVAPVNAPTDVGLLDASTSLPANLRSDGGSSGGDASEQDDARDGSSESVSAARKRSEAFSFAVAAILDQPLREQQRLLQTTDTGVRLRSLLRLLDAARRYLAAQSQIKDALS